MELTQTQKDAINKLQKDNDIETDLLYIIEDSEAEDMDELTGDIDEQSNGFQVEIIYHNRAMEYLANNDPSLQYSFQIAHELGFTTDKLNSELLASLLASQNERENFDKITDELKDILYPEA